MYLNPWPVTGIRCNNHTRKQGAKVSKKQHEQRIGDALITQDSLDCNTKGKLCTRIWKDNLARIQFAF
jgi:hypothetical protein